MSQSTIEWTIKTWNPTTGCTHISDECLNCYAEIMSKRLKAIGQTKYAKGFDTIVEHPYTLKEPYRWKKPTTVFVNSMSDLFHKDVSLDFIKQVFKVMNDTPQHTYQVLTKRHHRLAELSSEFNWSPNIWMGVSVGTQIATRRIEHLVNCDAKHKFLSIEPLIEEINDIDLTGIDWVIAGGESGYGARPVKLEWLLKIKDACEEFDVPFFFKQWGSYQFNPNRRDPSIRYGHPYHAKGGSQLDGKFYRENPTVRKLAQTDIFYKEPPQ